MLMEKKDKIYKNSCPKKLSGLDTSGNNVLPQSEICLKEKKMIAMQPELLI